MFLPLSDVGFVQVKSMVIEREIQSGSAWLSAPKASGRPVPEVAQATVTSGSGEMNKLVFQDIDALSQEDVNDLGRALAAFRRSAGHTQETLSKGIPWSRSLVANVERGHHRVPRPFWESCDGVLGAGGRLLDLFDRLTPTWSPGQHTGGTCAQCGRPRARKASGTGWPT